MPAPRRRDAKPDSIAALLASALFRFAVIALNAQTRMAPQTIVALDENGFLRVGNGLLIAYSGYRRALRSRSNPLGD